MHGALCIFWFQMVYIDIAYMRKKAWKLYEKGVYQERSEKAIQEEDADGARKKQPLDETLVGKLRHVSMLRYSAVSRSV